MKRLCALLLCALLFAGVLPARAFAETIDEAMGKLYDQVYGYDPSYSHWREDDRTLVEAYGMLAGAYAAQNFIIGMRNLADSVDVDGIVANLSKVDRYKDLVEQIILYSNFYIEDGCYINSTLFKEFLLSGFRSVLSYEGLWKWLLKIEPVYPYYYYDYDLIGDGIIANTEIQENKLAQEAVARYDEISAEVVAASSAAAAAALQAAQNAFP